MHFIKVLLLPGTANNEWATAPPGLFLSVSWFTTVAGCIQEIEPPLSVYRFCCGRLLIQLAKIWSTFSLLRLMINAPPPSMLCCCGLIPGWRKPKTHFANWSLWTYRKARCEWHRNETQLVCFTHTHIRFLQATQREKWNTIRGNHLSISKLCSKHGGSCLST